MRKNQKEFICLICGTKKIIAIKSVQKYCSIKCRMIGLNNNEENRKKYKQSLLEKYGVDHPSKIPGYREKVKQTCFKRYGNENYNNLEKNRETKLKKYGTISYNNLEQSRKTRKERYGNEKFVNLEKRIKTNIKKYGTESTFSSPIIVEKIKQTKLNKYGNSSYNNREKNKQTILNRYGVTSVSQLDSIKEKVNRTKFTNFYKKLFSGRLGENILPLFTLEEYKGVYEKYRFKCKKCNYEFMKSIVDGIIPICPVCFPNKLEYRSQYEKEINNLVQSWGFKTITNNRNIIPPYEIDIFIPDKNIGIEFDGLYWHSELGNGKNSNYHLDKLNKAIKNNIQLIMIFEDEWLLKNEIVISRLRNILGINDGKVIYARNCIVKEIRDSKLCQGFLYDNHIQGKDRSTKKLGLFFEDKLISVMTFSYPRLSLGRNSRQENEYELSRFCSDINYRVIGASGKLFSYFLNNYQPEIIYSYADKRFTTFPKESMYLKMGFELVKETSPNYWYMQEYSSREHRFSYRKDILVKEGFDKNLTEWEIMQLRGYDRIWDCGNWKFEWKKN